MHDPAEICCTTCHAGKASANTKENAHQNLEVFPGRMQTVEQSCGQSGRHAELIPLVQNSRMNTLDGMLSGMRRLFGEKPKKQSNPDLNQCLSEKGEDSYLRKLCVSCHLRSDRKNYQQILQDRGGGRAACHLQTHTDSPHPALSVRVDNDRCFGCAACVSLCPVDALVLDDILAIVDEPSCTHCNFCIPHCPVHALSIIKINI